MLRFSLQCFLLLFFFPASSADEFVFNGFTTDADLSFEGEASVDERRLGLTTGLDTGVVGHAFYKYPVSFIRSTKDHTVPSFTTSFVFEITSLYGEENDVNGFAFVVSSTNKFLNDSLPGRQYLGLPNVNTSINILAIKVEAFTSHVANLGIYINSLTSIDSYTTVGKIINSVWQLWVEYDGNTQHLNVTLGAPEFSKPKDALLSSHVNLSSLLPSEVYIGFSASTSIVANRQFILGWSFKKDGEAPQLNYSAFIEGWESRNNYSGGGPGLPVNTPISQEIVPHHNYISHRARRPPLRRLLPVVTLASLVLIVISVALGYVYKKRHSNKSRKQSDCEMSCMPPSFKYKDLAQATGGFKHKMLLGKGGFGHVYKGFLPASKENVAIKRICPESRQGKKEFISEITILGHVRHRNLVRLLGYCRHKHELLLVYDYMSNGSLDKYLYSQDKLALNWSKIICIIKSVASGLLYLHEEWEHVVIHRDIKSSNVLLDDEMNARLGDFGLARLHDHGVDAHTTRIAGTFGYIAPELARLGKATKATDVFAFGVLIMEVACGRRPVVVNARGEPQVLADHVISAWQDGSIMDSMDPGLEDYEAREVEMVLKLGLLCSHLSPKVRPHMRLVMQYLENIEIPLDYSLSFFSADATNDEVCDQLVASYSYPSAGTATTNVSGGR